MSKILFLEIDGVVNCKLWMNTDGKWVRRFAEPVEGVVNNTQAVQWISELCEKLGFSVVVTGEWRKSCDPEGALRRAGLRDTVKVIGTTDPSVFDKEEQIKTYLFANPDVEDYLVIDVEKSFYGTTNSDVLFAELSPSSHAGHYLLCRDKNGFGESEYESAIMAHAEASAPKAEKRRAAGGDESDLPMIGAALELLYLYDKLSTSLLQRKLSIGYGRSAAIIDTLTDNGVIDRVSERDGGVSYCPKMNRDGAKRWFEVFAKGLN